MILTGWKQISSHLGYAVRTVQRWEGEGLPIKRVTKSPRSPVIAEAEQLDEWIVRDSIKRGIVRSPNLMASIQRARELRAQAQRAKKALHVTMVALRKELASLKVQHEKYERR